MLNGCQSCSIQLTAFTTYISRYYFLAPREKGRKTQNMAITKEMAQNDGLIGGSKLIGEKEKLDFDSIVGEVITVEDFEAVKTKDGEAYALIFEEYPEYYAWAGGFLQKLISQYGIEFIGTKLKVGAKVKTKSKRDFRTFEIID